MVKWEKFNLTSNDWNEKLINLTYFSIYQSYEWGEIKRKEGWSVVRFNDTSSKKDSMVQVLYKVMPLKIVVFWIPGGILSKNISFDFSKLAKEFGCIFYYVRVSFLDSELKENIIIKNGWKTPFKYLSNNLTMKLDLTTPEEEIFKNMSSNWRHNSKRFFKNGNYIEKWESPDAEELFELYKKFEKLKNLNQQHSLELIKGVVSNFKDDLVVYVAKNSNNELLALRGYIKKGITAFDWYAITTEKGRNAYASYGLCWFVIKNAKSLGLNLYDFSGVDPKNNCGVFNFKKGTGAKLIKYPGEFEKSNFPGLRILANCKI